MTDFIKVEATNAVGKVALWEKHPKHPTGEVFVSGDGTVVEVANTAAVRAAIKAGALVEVQPEATKAPAKQETPLSYVAIAEQEPVPSQPIDEQRVGTAYASSAAIRQEGSKTTKR